MSLSRALLAGCLALGAAATVGTVAEAVSTAGPSGRVGPFPAFGIALGAGEESPRVQIFRSREEAGSGDGGTTLTTRTTAKGLRPFDPLEPGRWFWVGAAYRGSELVRSAPRKIVVRKVVEMDQVRFKRRGGQVSGSYRWRTNAPKLSHRVEVFLDGKRVSSRASRIEHSPGDRFEGERFEFSSALSDGKPPFGSVHPGEWRVRVSVKGAGERDSASKRYRVG